ncbi:hypothetical protein PIB30_091658 [Stylosanthes scabra]|uniref:CCHC-type domain-containing protein n=1 Tax=Stylosanthes scabra TaxID=79078 RepID=A0ABU6SX13_9FABA|nr:hypothetical protein [Stylosanthes scabra]
MDMLERPEKRCGICRKFGHTRRGCPYAPARKWIREAKKLENLKEEESRKKLNSPWSHLVTFGPRLGVAPNMTYPKLTQASKTLGKSRLSHSKDKQSLKRDPNVSQAPSPSLKRGATNSATFKPSIIQGHIWVKFKCDLNVVPQASNVTLSSHLSPRPSCKNCSVNPHGNDTLLTFYYLIRSGALVGGVSELRKDFGHQVFGAVGNRRDRQFFEYNPKIERTLTKNRNRVKAQKALQREEQEASFEESVSEGFSEEEIVEEISEEELQDNMVDDANNNQRRTLADFTTPTTVSCGSSIVRPTVEANNFELKPSLIHLVQQD